MAQKKVLPDALAQILATGSADPITPSADLNAGLEKPVDPPAVEPTSTPEAAASTPVVEAADAGLAAYLKTEISSLKTELSASKTSLTELQTANTALQAQLTALAADNVPGLKVALGNVVQRLAVPLNAVLVGVENYSGAQLVGAYESLNAKLSASFAPGAKSSTHETAPTSSAVNPSAVPLTNAARFTTKKD